MHRAPQHDVMDAGLVVVHVDSAEPPAAPAAEPHRAVVPHGLGLDLVADVLEQVVKRFQRST
jgi:hypothetical protein